MPCSFALKPVGAQTLSTIAAAAAIAAYAYAAFIFVRSRFQPSKPHAALRHPIACNIARSPAALSGGYCTRFVEPCSLLCLDSFLPVVIRRRASPLRCRRRGPSVTPTMDIRCRAYADAHCHNC
jgi:hypothetical protein